MGESGDADARRELDRARDSLHDARVLADGGGTDGGVLNRLYYAAFHAAQATLYARGLNPSSHGRVRQQFGQHVVLENDVSREDGRLLGTLYDHRQAADYGVDTPTVDIDTLIDDVDAFVETMQTIVEQSEE